MRNGDFGGVERRGTDLFANNRLITYSASNHTMGKRQLTRVATSMIADGTTNEMDGGIEFVVSGEGGAA